MTASTDHTYRTHLDEVMDEQGRMNTWLARVTGVTKGTVTHWRKGSFIPDEAKQHLICEALGRNVQFRRELGPNAPQGEEASAA